MPLRLTSIDKAAVENLLSFPNRSLVSERTGFAYDFIRGLHSGKETGDNGLPRPIRLDLQEGDLEIQG